MSEIKELTFDFKELPVMEQVENNKGEKKIENSNEKLEEQKQSEEETQIVPEIILFKEKCEKALLPIFQQVIRDYIKDYKAELTTNTGNLYGIDYFAIYIEWDFTKDDYLADKRPLKSIGLTVFRDIYESYKNSSKWKSKFESRGWKTWNLTPATTDKKTYVYLIKEASQMQRIDMFRSRWNMERSTVLGGLGWEEQVWAEIKRQLRHPDQN